MKEEKKELEKKKSGVSENFGKPIGIYELELIDKETGKVLETRKVKNLVVNNGKKSIRNGLKNTISWGYFRGIAIGKNGTAPTVDDTGLIEEYRYGKSLGATWDDTNKRWVNEVLFTDFTETVNICEAGLFWDVSGRGAMFSRVTFASIEVTPTKNLKVRIYIIP